MIYKRLIEIDLFGIDQIFIYVSLFFLHLNVKLRYKFAHETAHIFKTLTFSDSLENLKSSMERNFRDTNDKIEIEMKEVKETLSSGIASTEKSPLKG